MFGSYALAIGLGLAVIGLFCEIANHFKWSRRQKGWGGTFVAIGTMGVVLLIAEQVNQLAMATACSCAVLALSIRVSQTVLVEQKENHNQDSLPELVQSEPAHIEYVQAVGEEEVLVTEMHTVVEEQKLVEEVQAVVEELELVEEVQAVIEEKELVEEVHAVVEQQKLVEEVHAVVEEQKLVEEVQAVVEERELVEEVYTVVEQQELVEEVSVEWLNMQLANGFEAKSQGLFEQALLAFEAAAMYCRDAELSDMLQDEIADCYFQMRLTGELKILHAS